MGKGINFIGGTIATATLLAGCAESTPPLSGDTAAVNITCPEGSKPIATTDELARVIGPVATNITLGNPDLSALPSFIITSDKSFDGLAGRYPGTVTATADEISSRNSNVIVDTSNGEHPDAHNQTFDNPTEITFGCTPEKSVEQRTEDVSAIVLSQGLELLNIIENDKGNPYYVNNWSIEKSTDSDGYKVLTIVRGNEMLATFTFGKHTTDYNASNIRSMVVATRGVPQATNTEYPESPTVTFALDDCNKFTIDAESIPPFSNDMSPEEFRVGALISATQATKTLDIETRTIFQVQRVYDGK